MSEPSSNPDPSTHGEQFTFEMSFTWLQTQRLEAGESIVPASLSSTKAHTFAALNLVARDLSFALDCFRTADTIGIPDSGNLHSKALIFAGVVGYARCFKGGVRLVTLNPDELASKGAPFDRPIHEYLVALRDKHVAHSVNDFEDCLPIAAIIGREESGWRDGSGIGVAIRQAVGLSRVLLQRAINHVDKLKTSLEAELEVQRLAVYAEFKIAFQNDGKWKPAPVMMCFDRAKIGKRRD